jgi:hypothetical protein
MSKLTYLHLITYFSCNIVKIFIIKIEMLLGSTYHVFPYDLIFIIYMLLLGSSITHKLLKYMDSHYNFISHFEIYLL